MADTAESTVAANLVKMADDLGEWALAGHGTQAILVTIAKEGQISVSSANLKPNEIVGALMIAQTMIMRGLFG